MNTPVPVQNTHQLAHKVSISVTSFSVCLVNGNFSDKIYRNPCRTK